MPWLTFPPGEGELRPPRPMDPQRLAWLEAERERMRKLIDRANVWRAEQGMPPIDPPDWVKAR